MGIWHSYSTLTGSFDTINTLSLTRMGTNHVKAVSYLEKGRHRKRQQHHLKKLKPGLYKA